MSLLIPGTNSIKDTGYDVANSVRLNRGDSPNFTRTPSSASNRRTWTWSGWIKRSGLGNIQTLFDGSDGGYPEIFYFAADDTFIYQHDISGSDYKLISSQVFKDVGAWMHIVVAKDTTQSTETNRLKVYVNGSQITMNESALGYPPENYEGAININDLHIIGNWKTNSYYIDGYLAEVAFVDGTQLDATSFGEFDEDSPTIWKPKDVSDLTFGTNGFYLDFEDSSALGNDVSGNNNDYTANNLAATDQSTDTCTNNFATYNNLLPTKPPTFSEGNTKITQSGNNWDITYSTIGVSSGKWYMEVKWESGSQMNPGFATSSVFELNPSFTRGTNNPSNGGAIYTMYTDGSIYKNNSASSYGSGISSGNIQMLAMDLDNNKFYWGQNGTFQNSADPANNSNGFAIDSSHQGNTWHFHISVYGSGDKLGNFGNPAFSISSGNSDANGFGNFEYAVPSGFFALCTKNLAEFG